MAAKRKAAASSDQAPPTKRTTRSRAPLSETQPAVSATDRSPTKKRTARKTLESSGEEDSSEGEDVEVKLPVIRRGRPPKKSKSQLTPVTDVSPIKQGRGRPPRLRREDTANSEASSSKITIEALKATTDAEDSPDELLLSSPPQSRPSTPPAVTPRATAIPTVVLDAVEVATPRRTRSHATVLQSSSGKTASVVKKHTESAHCLAGIASPRIPALLLPQVSEAEAEDELNIFAPGPPQSPTKRAVYTPAHSPRKGRAIVTPHTSPSKLPRTLPSHFHANLHAQKRAALRALNCLSIPDIGEEDEELGPPTNTAAYQQLAGLLKGTVERGEGNSCLLIGPRGSGKTQILEQALSALPEVPIVIRLSGHAQTNDRLAMREIAWQLAEQTGKTLLPNEEDDDDLEENPFAPSADTVISLPPPSHLLALISMIPTLSRPTIVILDAVDLFALHARQALLYCLLDTAQSCRVGAGSKGLAVVGVTTRVDTINMLEKRVKSRFSGRMLRTACPRQLDDWVRSAKAALCTSIVPDGGDEEEDDWSRLWEGSVDMFFNDPKVLEVLRETFALSRDFRLLSRLLVQPVANLTPSAAFLTLSALVTSASIQRCPPRFAQLTALNYPSICLLISTVHARTSGHEAFTFEMLHETFRDQVRTSLSAPVQVEGGGIGMMRCSREVMIRTFETLVSQRLFVALAPPAVGTGKEFVKYRCAIDRGDVKRAVEKMGQLNLKKWFSKAQ